MLDFHLGSAFEKQTKQQADALTFLNLYNKIDELKQIESVFTRNQLNDLIIDKLEEIKQLQTNIKLENLEYTIKSMKNYGFGKCSSHVVFKQYTRGKIVMRSC